MVELGGGRLTTSAEGRLPGTVVMEARDLGSGTAAGRLLYGGQARWLNAVETRRCCKSAVSAMLHLKCVLSM